MCTMSIICSENGPPVCSHGSPELAQSVIIDWLKEAPLPKGREVNKEQVTPVLPDENNPQRAEDLLGNLAPLDV